MPEFKYDVPFKEINNFRVVRLDGTEFDVKDYGLYVNEYDPGAPDYEQYTDSAPGRVGLLDKGADIRGRTIKMQCTLEAYDSNDFDSKRSMIYNIFDSRQPFWLIRDQNKGKRILVRSTGGINIPQKGRKGKFTLTLFAAFPFWESVGDTSDPFNASAGVWGVGTGMINQDQVEYEFYDTTFAVWNGSDVQVDPRFMPLKINLYAVMEDQIIIRNTTNNTRWAILDIGNAPVYLEVNIDGLNSQVGGANAFRSTTKEFIVLEPGWNIFQVIGPVDTLTIDFEFKFYGY